MAEQPADLSNRNGVILSVGGFVGLERAVTVFPLVTDDNSALDNITRCSDAVGSFIVEQMATLLSCMPEGANVSFVQAEGMVDGMVPFRRDFDATENPGTRTGSTMPASVCPLIVFYSNPDDIDVGDPLLVGKNFLLGLSASDIDAGNIVDELLADMQTFAESLQTGFDSVLATTGKWYRVLSANRDLITTTIIRASAPQARGYIGTQRRRLLPH